MKICVCCCTYKRPQSLAYVVRCFERQTHADRSMVILDDAGQYDPQVGDDGRWEIVSVRRRFRTLGEKRNACAALAPPDAEAIAVWDDDDLYLPHALAASAVALENADWCRPSVVLIPRKDWSFNMHATGGLYHAGMVFRRGAVDLAGGYPPLSGPEDQGLFSKLVVNKARQADPFAMGLRPYYIYAGCLTNAANISALGCNQAAYDRMGMFVGERVATLSPADPPWFSLDAPEIHPGVRGRPF